MPSTWELRGRIQRYGARRTITRTMESSAATKLRQAQADAEAFQPYATILGDIVAHLRWAATDMTSDAHILLRPRSQIDRVLLVVCASERGLCGSYNSDIVRAAIDRARVHEQQGRAVEFCCFGRRGAASLRFAGRTVSAEYEGFIEHPDFERTRAISNLIMERFIAAEIDLVEVVHTRFIDLHRLEPTHFILLPCGEVLKKEVGPHRQLHPATYLFDPSPADLIARLVPRSVRIALYNGLLLAAAGEQEARRMAMRRATEATDRFLDDAIHDYHHARQAGVTQAISEIVGAVEALRAHS